MKSGTGTPVPFFLSAKAKKKTDAIASVFFFMERVTRLVCISPFGKLWFGSVQPSPATAHRAVAFHFSSLTRVSNKKTRPTQSHWSCLYGAGDEARTRYLHLGKVALYRMSYTRNGLDYYNKDSENVKHYFTFFEEYFSYVINR